MSKPAWYQKKWTTVLLHICAWLIIFSLPYLLSSHYDDKRPENPDSRGFFYLNTITGFFWVVVFYLNAYMLTPHFIYKKKYAEYGIMLLLIFSFTMFIHWLLFISLIHFRPFILLNSIQFNLPAYVLAVAVSIAYEVVRDRAKSDKLAAQKQEESLKTELSFLRSQISPHFVFNILNNMVALVRMKSDQLEPTIMKLSSLMQYMLYEADEEKVSLKTEAEYLQSYIDLQQQRFGAKVKMDISLQVEDDWQEIEPMLLIPFVENAFKHGVGMIENPQIDIHLHTKDGRLYFSVRNKYNEATPETKDKTSGIGLTNVQRRLNLLYGNKHTLIIDKNDGWFLVSLQLILH